MRHMRAETADPRIGDAVIELQLLIRQHFPDATFDVAHGDDPDGTCIWTAVDTDDPDAVLDVVVDRLLQLQIDQHVPVHVIPIHTDRRIQAAIEASVTG